MSPNKKMPYQKSPFLGSTWTWQCNPSSPSEYETKLTDGKLGPDALAVSSVEFPKRFKGTQREIKVAMLDQKIVLGIGNLYAAEILHLAGVHPQTRCDQITAQKMATHLSKDDRSL